MNPNKPDREEMFVLLAGAALLAGLVLIFHLKLGSVLVLAAGWTGLTRWLERGRGPSAAADPGREVLLSLRSGLIVSGLVFLGLTGLNIFARVIDPGWRWFQPP